jgi:hypothetical protein
MSCSECLTSSCPKGQTVAAGFLQKGAISVSESLTDRLLLDKYGKAFSLTEDSGQSVETQLMVLCFRRNWTFPKWLLA